MSSYKVIIAGGGTGGHIFPAVAIGHAIKRLEPSAQLLFVGANGKMEMEKVPQEGFEIVGLDIAGLNRSNMLKNIWLPFKLLKSAWRSRQIIRSFEPDVVIGVGGYASFPILNAAQGLGVPTLIQEQNSYAGKSNKILSKKANWICVAYEKMQQFFPVEKLKLTGNPVRALIVNSNVSKSEGVNFFGLNTNKKVVLVVGGSLGAKSINEAIAQELPNIVASDIQIVWQTGKPYHAEALQHAEQYSDMVKVYDFIKEMDKAYAAADVVVSRAGALAIAELCIVAKPVIFVPYPYAAEDHQTNNAMALVAADAAYMVKDNEVKYKLREVLMSLLASEQKQAVMRNALNKMAVKDADEQIAKLALSLTNKNRN